MILLWLAYKFTVCNAKIDALHEFSLTLNNSPVNLENLSERIEEIVDDTLSNIEMPTAQDHIAGGLMQMLQMFAMRKLGLDRLQDMMPQIQESADPTDFQENMT